MAFIDGTTGYLGDLLDVSTGQNNLSGDVLFFDGTEWIPNSTASLPALDERVFNLEVTQSTLPTQNDISTALQGVTSRFNVIDSNDNTQDETINLLIKGFASIKKTINDISDLFVTHTGLSGAHKL